MRGTKTKLSAAHPVAVGVDPFRSSRSPRWQRQVQDWHGLSHARAPTKRDDLLPLCQVNALHGDLHSEDHRLERQRKGCLRPPVPAPDLVWTLVAVDDLTLDP